MTTTATTYDDLSAAMRGIADVLARLARVERRLSEIASRQ